VRSATLLAAALVLAGAPVARAQSPADLLPREPGAAVDRAPRVTPPETPGPTGPIAATAADGPSFVLAGVLLEGATAVPEAELAPIWSGLIGHPVGMATLHEIVARIGAAYRARGLVLSQAVLPAQTVEDGVVRVLVVEGFVDRVAIAGGSAGQQARAAQLFAPVERDRPLRLTTLERGVLLARDTFGGSVETVLEPSPDTFAAADLSVLIEPDPFRGFGAVDNRGSRLYGAWTVSAGGSAYDLLGRNERLDGLVALAPRDGALAYAGGIFDLPLPSLDGTLLDGGRLEVSGDVSRADPDLSRSGSPDDLTVVQHETNLRAGLIVPFVRTRSQNLFGRVALTWQESESATFFAGTEDISDDRLLVLNARATWDLADRFGGVTLVDAELRQGLDFGGAAVSATGPAAGSPDFTLGRLDISRLQRLGDGPWSLWVEAIGQLAGTVLPNSERFSLGDATIGRGFAPGNTSGDSGFGGRLELRAPVGSGAPGATAAAELYAFGDYGRAYDRSIERDGEAWEELASVGFGARIDVRPWLTLTPEIARQTAGVATDTTDPDHETRFYIGAIARF
jgi:hemolysin activation/secretion protein